MRTKRKEKYIYRPGVLRLIKKRVIYSLAHTLSEWSFFSCIYGYVNAYDVMCNRNSIWNLQST